jgi:hypothetical protein
MKNKLLRIGVWVLVWIVCSIAFLEYLPQDPHMLLSVLISPITSLVELVDKLSSPFALATRVFSEEFKFGIFFWIVVGVLLYFPRQSKGSE